jgi:hypothetical protein
MSHCAPSEMNTSDSLIPMFGYTFSAMTLRRFCAFPQGKADLGSVNCHRGLLYVTLGLTKLQS